ncbi:hypothetical protein [Anaerotignum sp.]|nr:hypothetical protein [Anaerotignum sp.]
MDYAQEKLRGKGIYSNICDIITDNKIIQCYNGINKGYLMKQKEMLP